MKKYEWVVTGEKMLNPVFIETQGETTVQAILRAREEANKRNLDWDNIEYRL